MFVWLTNDWCKREKDGVMAAAGPLLSTLSLEGVLGLQGSCRQKGKGMMVVMTRTVQLLLASSGARISATAGCGGAALPTDVFLEV